MTTETGQKQTTTGTFVRAGVVLFVFLSAVAWIGLTLLSGGAGNERPEVTSAAAERACEDWARAELKAPSTAQFRNVESVGDGPWAVTGAVDAENSYGATVRSTWSCNIRLVGDTFRGSATVTQ